MTWISDGRKAARAHMATWPHAIPVIRPGRLQDIPGQTGTVSSPAQWIAWSLRAVTQPGHLSDPRRVLTLTTIGYCEPVATAESALDDLLDKMHAHMLDTDSLGTAIQVTYDEPGEVELEGVWETVALVASYKC